MKIAKMSWNEDCEDEYGTKSVKINWDEYCSME